MVSTLVHIMELVEFVAQESISNLVNRRDMNIDFPNTITEINFLSHFEALQPVK